MLFGVNKINNKLPIMASVCFCLLCFLIFLIPLSAFKHGYYYIEPEFNSSVPIIVKNLEFETVSQEFTPISNDITGVEFRVSGYKPGMKGKIIASVKNEFGKDICSEELDISKITADGWRQVYFDAKLKRGEKYVLTLKGEKANTNLPNVVFVEKDSLQSQSENLSPSFVDGGKGYVLFTTFAYSKQSFSNYEKTLLLGLCYSAFFLMLGWYINRQKYRLVALFGACVVVLSWNYTNNAFDNANIGFKEFQHDSENLVADTVYANMKGIPVGVYGLGITTTISGDFTYRILENKDAAFLSTNSIDRGYSSLEPVIVLPYNSYNVNYIVPWNQIEFANGQRFSIVSVDNKDAMYVHLNSDKPLSHVINGSIQDAKLLDPAGSPLPSGTWRAYSSQYGLQGKILSWLSSYTGSDQSYFDFEFICSLVTAFVLTLITFFLAIKYNKLLAGISYFTFLLSPWVVNFARNTYWVEFTWFLPMLIGLVTSIYISRRKYRIIGYLGAAVSILIKSLCGYEYITAVMMGLISFLLVDVLLAIVEHDKQKFRLVCRTTIIIGIFALLGFFIAIIIHSNIRGNGDILAGIKSIWEQDVMRRATGGHLQDFDSVYWLSLNASNWEVICMYFKFSTEIITGISGNLFPLFALTPLLIFVYDYYNSQRVDFTKLFLYIIMFITSTSWYYLAKPHSYIHTHMNFVLWYFGFVQICFYIIISRFIQWVNHR